MDDNNDSAAKWESLRDAIQPPGLNPALWQSDFCDAVLAIDPASYPPGLSLAQRRGNSICLQYRKSGMLKLALQQMLGLVILILACSYFTLYVIEFGVHTSREVIFASLLPLGWLGVVVGPVVMLWQFCSATSFLFETEAVIIENSVFRTYGQLILSRALVTVVWQVRDSAKDDIQTFRLAIASGQSIENVLTQETQAATECLGSIIAAWAGVPYMPWVEERG